MTKHRGRRTHLTLHRRPLIIPDAVSNQLQLFAPPPKPAAYALHFDGPGKATGKGPVVMIIRTREYLDHMLRKNKGYWWNFTSEQK